MSKFYILLVTFLIIVAAETAGMAQEPIRSTQGEPDVIYVNLKPTAEKYDLKHERDFVTGREIFSDNGTKLIVCSGMLLTMVNDDVFTLQQRAKIVNGEIAVTAGDLAKIENKIKKAKQQHISKTSGVRKVVIDPGHGGSFAGARANGVVEKNITLSISLKLKTILEAREIKVVMTRTTDNHLSPHLDDDLDRRVAVANREQPDLFISVHGNFCDNSSVRGFELYYCPDKPIPTPKTRADKIDTAAQKILGYALREEYLQQTLELASEVEKSFCKLPTENRGIRQANFRVIKKTECPALLVEVDYVSNRTMAKQLCTESYQDVVAERLAQAIFQFDRRRIIAEGGTK